MKNRSYFIILLFGYVALSISNIHAQPIKKTKSSPEKSHEDSRPDCIPFVSKIANARYHHDEINISTTIKSKRSRTRQVSQNLYLLHPHSRACKRISLEQLEVQLIDAPSWISLKTMSGHRYILKGARGRQKSGRHEFDIAIMDPTTGQTLNQSSINLSVESKWDGAMVPSVGGSFYLPNGLNAEPDLWRGVDIEFSLYSWVAKNPNPGPAYGKFYINTSLMESSKDSPLLIIYGVGLQLSFEKNPQRSWLIPQFGLNIGGISNTENGKQHNDFQITPLLGLHLFTNDKLSLYASGGYLVTPTSNLERRRGWRGMLSAQVYLW